MQTFTLNIAMLAVSNMYRSMCRQPVSYNTAIPSASSTHSSKGRQRSHHRYRNMPALMQQCQQEAVHFAANAGKVAVPIQQCQQQAASTAAKAGKVFASVTAMPAASIMYSSKCLQNVSFNTALPAAGSIVSSKGRTNVSFNTAMPAVDAACC